MYKTYKAWDQKNTRVLGKCHHNYVANYCLQQAWSHVGVPWVSWSKLAKPTYRHPWTHSCKNDPCGDN